MLLFRLGQATAQGEENHWYFHNAEVRFTPNGPSSTRLSSLFTEEGSAVVSDPAGNLLFYTDGATVWTRQHQLMPGGTNIGLPMQYSSTQGALIVQDPGDPARYYLFRQAAYAYPNGFAYLIVDMRLNNGLGAVVGPTTALSPTTQLAEKLAGVLHANGRDTWVLVHGVRSNNYYAYLVTPTGISPTPVVSSVGALHGPAPGALGNLGFGGYLRASPNGTKLASAVSRYGQLELLDFDPATGRVSNARALGPLPEVYGVEFSADGSKLYASTEIYRTIVQYDLLAGANLAQSKVVVGQVVASNSAHALLRGPDGRIYVAQEAMHLGVITSPNTQGRACGYQERGVSLLGYGMYGLPNFPNQHPRAGRLFARIASAPACDGLPASFTASIGPAPTSGIFVYRWNFGDPSSGNANTATGLTPSHRYAGAGTYLVTLQVEGPAGQVVATTTTLQTVAAGPAVTLPARRTLCSGDSLLLDAGNLAGATYRWQDGTTGTTYRVRRPGTYRVTVTSAQGCSASDSVLVEAAVPTVVTLGPDTAMCSISPEVVLRPSPQPAGTTYRWSGGATTATFTATQPGLYWVEVHPPLGCAARASVQIRHRECPVLIPNVITPNADASNDSWVLKGLVASHWSATILNRWGKQVYYKAAYDNQWQANGLPAGIYYYLLVNHETQHRYRGWVEVVR